jgi:hypothetical protein
MREHLTAVHGPALPDGVRPRVVPAAKTRQAAQPTANAAYRLRTTAILECSGQAGFSAKRRVHPAGRRGADAPTIQMIAAGMLNK